MEIKIQIIDEEGNTIAQRTALTFESAGEDLGKLESYYKKITS